MENKFMIDSDKKISNLDTEKFPSCHNFEEM